MSTVSEGKITPEDREGIEGWIFVSRDDDFVAFEGGVSLVRWEEESIAFWDPFQLSCARSSSNFWIS